jgi:predicted RNA-binding Zn-ribbon protein involved in translation (DUF1610 family)
MSYYESGMGAALVSELNKDKLTFIGGTGLLAIQLRDTCLFADAADAQIRAVCVWKSEDGYDQYYETSCGGQWDENTEDMMYCPYCGKRIERQHPVSQSDTSE